MFIDIVNNRHKIFLGLVVEQDVCFIVIDIIDILDQSSLRKLTAFASVDTSLNGIKSAVSECTTICHFYQFI